MENIFLEFFNLSINAGWLVLSVLLLRLFMKKSPKWIHCILWSIVGIRLLLPFSAESIFGLFPSEEFIAPDTLYEALPTVDSGFDSINQVINPVFSEVFAATPENSVNPLQIITAAVSYLWITGIIVMLCYTLFTYIKLKIKVRTATKITDKIFESENVSSPFILGVIRPKIYLPYNLGEKDREYVIAHETAHLKRADHLIKPFAFLLLTVYWFNPLMWLSYILLCRDIELACDEKVVGKLGKDCCKEYSYALLNCSINKKSIAACPLAFGEVGVKDRVKNILSYKRPAFLIIAVSVTVCIITALCFLTTQRTVPLSHGYQYEPLSVVTTDKIEITAPDSTYVFTDEKQIEYLCELINDIRVNKRKTQETDTITTSYVPYPAYVIKGYAKENQTYELCISSDFRNIWTSEDYTCEYLFTAGREKDLRSLMTQKVVNAYLKEQTALLIPELIKELYGFSSYSDGMYCAESHFVFKEEFKASVSSDEYSIDSINMYVIYNCSVFSNEGGKTTARSVAQGMSEFIFSVYGDKVVFDDINEHVRGEGALIDGLDTTETDEKLKAEVLLKAEKYFNTDNSDENSVDSNAPSDSSLLYTSEITYDIVPIRPVSLTDVNKSNIDEIENNIKRKAFNNSHLIRNINKQAYGSEYCLIYREDNYENLISDYALYTDMDEKAKELVSLEKVIDKYSELQTEKDLYIVYIPDSENEKRYEVTGLTYNEGCVTAILTSYPSTNYIDKNYYGYLAVIYADKIIGESYSSFTAKINGTTEILQNADTVNLSDIDDMNIGAEMPTILYCDKGRLIMQGTFGLIIFDLNLKKVTDRIDYNVLEKLEIVYLSAYVSSDGERIYITNNDYSYSASSAALYTYYVKSKTLFYYNGEMKNDTLYGELRELEGNGSSFIPEKGYIYSYLKKQDDYGKTYLRARDNWQMKTLQVVTEANDGTKEICGIFNGKAEFIIQ